MTHYLATILSVDHSQLTMLVDVDADILHSLKTFYLLSLLQMGLKI